MVTTRPIALTDTHLPSGFVEVQIAPLDDKSIDIFLSQWCKALYAEAPEKSECLFDDLKTAIQARPAIHLMARTPVMLTALAVVYWNEHRLPEQRAELYESIITWLLRSREKKPGRLSADRCRCHLEELAFKMLIPAEGRKRQADLRWAAEAIADQFNPKDKEKGTIEAEAFLKAEMIDSGIIVERQRQVEFWHLSFQEYLAACRISGFLDNKMLETVFADGRIYKGEWREVILLLGGVLYSPTQERINNLIDEVIKRGPQEATGENLPVMAKEVGILGGIVRDLATYDFSPSNPQYSQIVKGVMGIFEKERYKSIPVQVRIEAADTLGQVGDPRLHDDPMIFIPGGRFWMGAQKKDPKGNNYDNDAYDDEFPVHKVELSTYKISKYPVTVGQYLRFIEDGGYQERKHWGAGEFGEYEKPDNWEDQLRYTSRPVVYVSWFEAAAYASWCGGRLPTEAEWERAARGPGDEYRKYPWGNKEPTKNTANWYEAGIGHATPVGIFPEDCSPEGVIDMAGNVWEWCQDWYSGTYYEECTQKGIVKDTEGPEKGLKRVLRGGAFRDRFLGVLRCASRYGDWPGLRSGIVGFRVVRP
ncbi:MAG: SUMF1/EgtB/PvdO family nonheme iron enzyme [bacterium]